MILFGMEKKELQNELKLLYKGTDNESSWKALLGKLYHLHRTKMFDKSADLDIPFQNLIKSSTVSIFDLSDSDSTLVNSTCYCKSSSWSSTSPASCL